MSAMSAMYGPRSSRSGATRSTRLSFRRAVTGGAALAAPPVELAAGYGVGAMTTWSVPVSGGRLPLPGSV